MRIKDCTEVCASQVVGLLASTSRGLALGWGRWSSGGHICFQVSSVRRAACLACSLKGKQGAAFAGEGGLPGRAEGAGAGPGGPRRTCVRCGGVPRGGAEGRARVSRSRVLGGGPGAGSSAGGPAGKGSPVAPRCSPARPRALPSLGADGGHPGTWGLDSGEPCRGGDTCPDLDP